MRPNISISKPVTHHAAAARGGASCDGSYGSRLLRFAAPALIFLMAAASAEAAFLQQGAKLVGAGAVGTANQGTSVAVSADGNTAVVGGFGDDGATGAAWVFTRSAGVWSQQGAKLVGTGAVGAAGQGWSVAMSADGNTAVVGGYSDDGFAGAAWVFIRSAGVWSQQGAKLVGAGAVGTAQQGWSVAVSADGNTAVVGGYADNGFAGAAWVFTRSGGVWSQQGTKLVGTGAVGAARQGYSVAVSADGNTAVVGGYYDNSGVGAAWVWTRSGGVWSQQGTKLVGTGTVGAGRQGTSVAVSADGNSAVVGGPLDNVGAGAAWVWTRSGGVWSQQGAKLVGTGAVGAAEQGNSVAVSADGNTAFVGGHADNGVAGAAWVYTRSGGVWSQQGAKLVGTGAVGVAEQGWSVAVSADGMTAVVGGIGDNGSAGAAWVFVDPAPGIVAISDVPDDQGGKVHVLWNASLMDSPALHGISSYTLWRRIITTAALEAVEHGAALVRSGADPAADAPDPQRRSIRVTREGMEAVYWEFVASMPARGVSGYGYMAPTTSDSLPGSIPWNVFFVDAQDAATSDFYVSPADSGYSVDNLAPASPAPATAAYSAGATHLHWGANGEADFALYRVYRGSSEGFVPGPGNLVTSQADTGYADVGPAGSYYKLSAVDVHGNESAFALITPSSTLDAPGASLPREVALAPVVPNPLRGGGTFHYALPREAAVSLAIYDVTGRRVRVLVRGLQSAGEHLAPWDGRDDGGRMLANGVYFLRLEAAGRSLVARFVEMR